MENSHLKTIKQKSQDILLKIYNTMEKASDLMKTVNSL